VCVLNNDLAMPGLDLPPRFGLENLPPRPRELDISEDCVAIDGCGVLRRGRQLEAREVGQIWRFKERSCAAFGRDC
jgi:hypothetical protein